MFVFFTSQIFLFYSFVLLTNKIAFPLAPYVQYLRQIHFFFFWKFQTLQDSEKRSQYDQVATPKLLEKYSIASASCPTFLLICLFVLLLTITFMDK